MDLLKLQNCNPSAVWHVMFWEFNLAVNIFGLAIVTIMKIASLLALPATALLLGFSSLTFPDRTTANSNTVLAQSQPEPSQERRHPPRIDFAAAAKQLGVTEAELIEALGLPPNPPEPPNDNNRPPSPPPPPRLDIPGAAKKLGVTEAELIKILGIPPRPPGDRNLPQNSEKR
ncbi:hypothetical protein QUB76_19865 [Microcoleus sp. D2B6]|uniref:hypothetical protein n=2 Tax=Microcoleus TaxID=44471 RepID=UPI002FCF50D2